MATLLIMLS